VIARNQSGAENFHQSLAGRVTALGAARLAGTMTGPMLNANGMPVRNCQLTLNLIPPERTSPQPATPFDRSELQRLLDEAAVAKQKVAELEHQLAGLQKAQDKDRQENQGTRQQLHGAEADHQQLFAEVEKAKQRTAEAERQILAVRDAQKNDQIAAQTQKQQMGKSLNHIEEEIGLPMFQGSVGPIILPVTERTDDWIIRKAAVPIQQQEFCRIVDQFYDDLEQVRLVRNDIRSNRLYQDRQKDFDALLPHGAFENWLVRVVEVTQVRDGSAAIVLRPPCRIMLGSDACQKDGSQIRATIKPDTTLFRELEKLRKNDFVAASGTFLYSAKEEPAKPLPLYADYKPGEYCYDQHKDSDVFVTDIRYLVQLR
jgi:hypothetical protein